MVVEAKHKKSNARKAIKVFDKMKNLEPALKKLGFEKITPNRTTGVIADWKAIIKDLDRENLEAHFFLRKRDKKLIEKMREEMKGKKNKKSTENERRLILKSINQPLAEYGKRNKNITVEKMLVNLTEGNKKYHLLAIIHEPIKS